MTEVDAQVSIANDVLPITTLIVEPSLLDASFLVSALPAAFQITLATKFHEAKNQLQTSSVAVLITALRLGEYNGLHLLLHAMDGRSPVASLITSATDDVVLRAEAERMGATFVSLPVSREELLAAVYRTALARDAGAGREPIRGPFERRRRDRRSPTLGPSPLERRIGERRADPAGALRRRVLAAAQGVAR